MKNATSTPATTVETKTAKTTKTTAPKKEAKTAKTAVAETTDETAIVAETPKKEKKVAKTTAKEEKAIVTEEITEATPATIVEEGSEETGTQTEAPTEEADVPTETDSAEAEPATEVVPEKKKREKAPLGTIKKFGDRNYIQTEKGWRYYKKSVEDILLDDRYAQFSVEGEKVIAKVSQDVLKRLETIMDNAPAELNLFTGDNLPTTGDPIELLGQTWIAACVYHNRATKAVADKNATVGIYKGYFEQDGVITAKLVTAEYGYNRIHWFKFIIAEQYSNATVDQIKAWIASDN